MKMFKIESSPLQAQTVIDLVKDDGAGAIDVS